MSMKTIKKKKKQKKKCAEKVERKNWQSLQWTHPGESSSSKTTVSIFSARIAVATSETFPAPI